jgi:hypothetical protein
MRRKRMRTLQGHIESNVVVAGGGERMLDCTLSLKITIIILISLMVLDQIKSKFDANIYFQRMTFTSVFWV